MNYGVKMKAELDKKADALEAGGARESAYARQLTRVMPMPIFLVHFVLKETPLLGLFCPM